MQNFKWTSDDKYATASVTMRIGGRLTTINAHNITENMAAVLRNTPKYMHLIEEINDNMPGTGEMTAKSETTASKASGDITSTLTLQPNAEKTVKRRKKKQA